MRIPRQAGELALLQVLRRHLLTRAHDRLLYGELEAAWTSEIGQCGRELRDTVLRLARAGVFAWHETVAGEEIELTERGAREIRCLDSVTAASATAGSRVEALFERLRACWPRHRSGRAAALAGHGYRPAARDALLHRASVG